MHRGNFKMSESELIMDNKTLEYEGVFSVSELFSVVNETTDSLGYERQEKKSEQKVVPEGREFYIELRPYKFKTNYVSLMLKIKFRLTEVIDVEKTVKGITSEYQHGKVTFVLDAWSQTNYREHWNIKPWVYFMKTVINKYVYKLPLEEGFMNELGADAATVFDTIENHLKNFVYDKNIEKKEEIKHVENMPLLKKN